MCTLNLLSFLLHNNLVYLGNSTGGSKGGKRTTVYYSNTAKGNFYSHEYQKLILKINFRRTEVKFITSC